MTTKARDISTRVIRCAVCKIDLKGRFVFVDDASELLFGHTKEDLFGKYFIDFVDESDKDIISLILHKRNHYESFFDSTHVHIFGHDRKLIEAAVVISLNFIAGNPVNFQIIINTETPEERIAVPPTDPTDIDSIYADLLECESLGDWKRICPMISDLSQASWVLLYRLTHGVLEPLVCKSLTEPEALGFTVAPELTSLHKWVADNNEEYSFIDHDMVRFAIERDGVAPNEYVTTLSLGPTDAYLLRLIFSETSDTQGVHKVLSRVHLFTHLLVRLFSKSKLPTTQKAVSGNWDQFKSMCDDLQIGVCFADARGRVQDWNIMFATTLDTPEVGETLIDVVAKLKERNRPEIVSSLLDYLLLAPGRTSGLSASADVVLRSGESARVTLRCLVDSSSDLSYQMTILPLMDIGQDQALKAINSTAFSAILGELQSPLFAASSIVEKLGHEYFDRLGREGNVYLQSLGDKMNKLNGMIGDLSGMISLLSETETMQIIDLNLLTIRVIEEVTSLHPSIPIRIHHHELPKISTQPRKLSAVLRLIFSNSVRFSGDKGADISLGAVQTDETCVISITDDGPGVPSKYLSKITDFFFRVPDPAVLTIPGRGTGLAVARQLIIAMGGQLTVESKSGKGTTVVVTIPNS